MRWSSAIGGTVVLKGAGTLVGSGGRTRACASAAIPAWRVPARAMCSPAPSPASWPSAAIRGRGPRRRPGACAWPGMPRHASVSAACSPAISRANCALRQPLGQRRCARWTRSAADTEAFRRRAVRAPGRARECLRRHLPRGRAGRRQDHFGARLSARLRCDAAVRSPTYTLLEPYALGSVTGAARRSVPAAGCSGVESLGLRDWARPGYLWLIEWPERGAGCLPPPDLACRLRRRRAGTTSTVAAPPPWRGMACAAAEA